MDVPEQARVERLRQQVAQQGRRTRALFRESKELRAAASALVDQTMAVRLSARTNTPSVTPPIPSYPPQA